MKRTLLTFILAVTAASAQTQINGYQVYRPLPADPAASPKGTGFYSNSGGRMCSETTGGQVNCLLGQVYEALGTPAAPTITHAGAGGAATYSYAVAFSNAVGDSISSADGTTTTGNETLDGTNYNIVTPPACPAGATAVQVWRTAAPDSVVGYLGKIACAATLHDTGLAPIGADVGNAINATQGVVLPNVVTGSLTVRDIRAGQDLAQFDPAISPGFFLYHDFNGAQFAYIDPVGFTAVNAMVQSSSGVGLGVIGAVAMNGSTPLFVAGGNFYVQNDSSNAVDNGGMYAVAAQAVNEAPNALGFMAGLQVFSASGATANLYGISIADQTSGANSYALLTGLGRVKWGDVTQDASVSIGNLPSSPQDGDHEYCSDCKVTSGIDNTCVGSGGGSFAYRVAGAWKCYQ